MPQACLHLAKLACGEMDEPTRKPKRKRNSRADRETGGLVGNALLQSSSSAVVRVILR